jgi:hypothetical protein
MRPAARQARRSDGAAAALAVLAVLALTTLTACSTTRQTAPNMAAPQSAQPPPAATAAPEVPAAQETPPGATEIAPPVEQPPAAAASAPPPRCACSQPAPKPRPKHKHRKKEAVKRTEPQSVGPEPPPPTTVVDAEVGRIDGPLTSILGKNVYSPKGEDLGRVVDLLADPDGRVRVAIIDFGGFLGVGTRRIAVDWPLLHFSPTDKAKPLMLTVTREKLQSAPEYKDSASPRVLMPPAAAPDAAGAGTKK